MKATVEVYDTEFNVEFERQGDCVSVTWIDIDGKDVGGLLQCRQLEDAIYNAIDDYIADMFVDESNNNE